MINKKWTESPFAGLKQTLNETSWCFFLFFPLVTFTNQNFSCIDHVTQTLKSQS